MGTDIHLYVEKQIDGKWQEIEPPYKYPSGGKSWSPYWESRDFNDPRPDPTNRHYDLFAFLADVRNGYGFAGVYRHEKVTPQFADRGIPAGCSYREPEYDDDGERVSGSDCYMGDHSFTYASLTELINAPWSIEFQSGGTVGPDEFKNWRDNGVPNRWSGDISGQCIHTWNDPEVYGLMVDRNIYRRRENGDCLDYCFVTWKWKPLENCGFYRWCNEILLPLADGNTDNIRVLMGFDS